MGGDSSLADSTNGCLNSIRILTSKRIEDVKSTLNRIKALIQDTATTAATTNSSTPTKAKALAAPCSPNYTMNKRQRSGLSDDDDDDDDDDDGDDGG